MISVELNSRLDIKVLYLLSDQVLCTIDLSTLCSIWGNSARFCLCWVLQVILQVWNYGFSCFEHLLSLFSIPMEFKSSFNPLLCSAMSYSALDQGMIWKLTEERKQKMLLFQADQLIVDYVDQPYRHICFWIKKIKGR